ncbi:selenium metabolism-associated LysR family transcriptional regulator [Desulfogranum marinum]|uniref:selenium metabolism-associated LysR family transcriptional regulator n=1 Tax=Desulfogranum marinum TaxID=453220 RepID=UPI0019644236|nr:selenium metabolism-associated LysR family transcriptional regulator [Desulfogranum marinum]MBM9511968.1 LysR family transcriptional regulator [Desulfogranum marinum]
MDIRKLEVFCKVVEYKSFTKASQWAMISQPTVSEHIRNLEEQLGQKLFDRLGRHVEATPVGQLFYSYALKIIRLQQASLEAIEEFSGHLKGRIIIGASTIPGTYILPCSLAAFLATYSEVKVDINIANSKSIAQKVIEGTYDIGIIGAAWNDKALDWHALYMDELLIIVPANSPLAQKKNVPVAEILQHPFIHREQGSGTRKVVAKILENKGLKEKNVFEIATIGSTAAVKEAVKAGLGISILSKKAVAEEIKNGTLVGLTLDNEPMERPFYLIQRKNRELTPIAAAFTTFLIKKLPKQSSRLKE